jgi:RNase P/RNase MRP subunit p29
MRGAVLRLVAAAVVGIIPAAFGDDLLVRVVADTIVAIPPSGQTFWPKGNDVFTCIGETDQGYYILCPGSRGARWVGILPYRDRYRNPTVVDEQRGTLTIRGGTMVEVRPASTIPLLKGQAHRLLASSGSEFQLEYACGDYTQNVTTAATNLQLITFAVSPQRLRGLTGPVLLATKAGGARGKVVRLENYTVTLAGKQTRKFIPLEQVTDCIPLTEHEGELLTAQEVKARLALDAAQTAKGLIKVDGKWVTEAEKDRITKDRAQQAEKQMRQKAELAAFEKAQAAKGLVKVKGTWFRKVNCSGCEGRGTYHVTRPAEWVVDYTWEPGAATMRPERVRVPPVNAYVTCYSCNGTGYRLIAATE